MEINLDYRPHKYQKMLHEAAAKWDLETKIRKHLESAITHGWNDAQEDSDGLSEVCRMEAQQNLRNVMEDINKEIAKAKADTRREIIREIKQWTKGRNVEKDKLRNYLNSLEIKEK